MTHRCEHSGRSATVTGAGGGLGRDIARGLATKGYVVFGTAMSAAEVEDMKNASGGRVSLAVCDMTKGKAVKAWAGGVSDALGDAGPGLLINNAGSPTPGPIGGLPPDPIPREFDAHVVCAPAALNGMQGSGLASVAAANRVIELAEQVPAPSRAAVGEDAEEMLRLAHEKSDTELDALRLQIVGLS